MSLFLLCKIDGFKVIGELTNAILVSGQNTNQHIKISFTDDNVLEFIKDWIYSHSINPVDEYIREICLYDDIDKSASNFLSSVSPNVLKDQKDWFGTLITENVYSIEYDSYSAHFHDITDVNIVTLTTMWKRDKKINQIIG